MNKEIAKIGEIALNPVIINPFNKESIISLYVSLDLVVKRGKPEWISRGTVDFKQGDTSGRQQFTGPSFDDVVLQIKSFINEKL